MIISYDNNDKFIIKFDDTNIVTLTKEEAQKMFVVECCPDCNTEQIIWAEGITQCPLCHVSIAPCSLCYECTYNNCPYDCDGTENDLFKQITKPMINFDSAESCMEMYNIL